tara:strand:+ start:823 stop:960 length:138 start_codon:yes stop_codon:yes gene_type:complete
METKRSIEEILEDIAQSLQYLEDIAQSLQYLVKLKELARLGASYD